MRRGGPGRRLQRSDARAPTPNREQPAMGNGRRSRVSGSILWAEKIKSSVEGARSALECRRGRTSASNAASALSTSPVIFENSVMTTTTTVSLGPAGEARSGRARNSQSTPDHSKLSVSRKIESGFFLGVFSGSANGAKEAGQNYKRGIPTAHFEAREGSVRAVVARSRHAFQTKVYPRLLVYRGAKTFPTTKISAL